MIQTLSCKFFMQTLPKKDSYLDPSPPEDESRVILGCWLEREWDDVKCKATPYNGPCWWWRENQGDVPDKEFVSTNLPTDL